MANFSNYLENKILDHTLGTTSYTMPTPRLALYTVAPNDAGSGTEVSGNGYSRQAITFGPATSGQAGNSSTPTFTATGGAFGTIVAIGIFDAATGGNLLYHGLLQASKTIGDGESLSFNPNNITIQLD